MNNSLVRTFQKTAVETDMETMRLNNRERFAILIGTAWWLTLVFYAVRWLIGHLS